MFKEKFGEAITKILYVGHFNCVSDGKEAKIRFHQVMRRILCYHNVVNILNLRIKEKKGLITYYTMV
jgi:hypothetical protein